MNTTNLYLEAVKQKNNFLNLDSNIGKQKNQVAKVSNLVGLRMPLLYSDKK